jgi:hypothetical protein
LGGALASAQEPTPTPPAATGGPAAAPAQAPAPRQQRQPLGPPTLVEHLRQTGAILNDTGPLGSGRHACDPCRLDWCYCPPQSWVRAEFLWWTRTAPRQVVGVDLGAARLVSFREQDTQGPFGPQPVSEPIDADVGLFDSNSRNARDLSSGDALFREQPGFRIFVGQAIQPGLDVEGGFFWLREHEGRADFFSAGLSNTDLRVSTAGDLVSKFSTIINNNTTVPVLAPFDFAQTANVVYLSQLMGGEVNLRWHPYFEPRLPIALVAGLRYLRQTETFAYNASTTITDSAGVTRPITGTYSVDTENHLVGLQIGTDVEYFLTSYWSLIGRLRGGLLLNFASQDSAILGAELLNTKFQNGPILSSTPFNATGSGSHTGLSGMVEFGIHTSVQINERVALLLGYNGLMLTSMALAPKQMEFSTAPGAQNVLRHGGTVFYYGPSVAMQVNW